MNRKRFWRYKPKHLFLLTGEVAVEASRILITVGFAAILMASAIKLYSFVDDYLAGRRAQAVLEQVRAQSSSLMDPIPTANTPPDVPASPVKPALPETDYNTLDEQDVLTQISPIQQGSNTINSDSAAASLELVQSKLIYDTIGVVSIPKFSLDLPILSECTDSLLKVSVCRYRGSAQDKPERLVVAGHNYKNHFGKLSRLILRDEICFTNSDGIKYFYTVSDIIEVSMHDYRALEQDDWDVTLFTCNSDGSRRILVRCKEKQ